MKKIFILVLMVLVGISLFSLSFADEARTIPMKSGYATYSGTVITATLVVGHGGTLYKISGRATGGNAAYYVVYDAATAAATAGATTNSQVGILAEGGEATQYDSIEPQDFGTEGIPFNLGLVIVSYYADVCVQYR